MILLKTAVVVTPHSWVGDGVADGASLVIFIAKQGLATLLCRVGADFSLHTTTPVLYEGIFHTNTATFWAGIRGFVSNVSAVLVGVMTACGAHLPLVTVSTVFSLVDR